MRAVTVFALLFGVRVLLAQHGYSPGEVDEGRRLFLANCAVCHGPEGASVPGTDIGHGKFRRGNTDSDLIQIIRNGIPGTAMPPHSLSEFQAGSIVGYLRFLADAASDAASSRGNPIRGEAVFRGKGACLSCHRVKGEGSRLGPDLSDIGARRRIAELERSMADPDSEILPQNRFVRLVTADGSAITGRLLNQDAFTVQLFDPQERLLSFPKAGLREFAFLDKSPMPSYKDKLSAQEMEDLVSYLVSLKGIEKP
ncbi:MAG TPA: c-type cytochrome [Bryobacterales bacterium]|jgi:cytochrome c oxidase cbb3-type subunit 3|nr:c-type cytochrome [Bryobacterales bacterium]